MLLHRREAMLRLGQVGLGALTLPGLLNAERAQGMERGAATRGRAKYCILLFLWGGPPQQDMWDMKPDAPQGIRSQFQPIETVVPGIRICDQMPLLTKHTDKVAFVRSLTHNSDVHEAPTGVTAMHLPRAHHPSQTGLSVSNRSCRV